MSDKIDLHKMEQRANRLLSQDGLMEILMGAIFFVSSASFTTKGAFVPFLPLYIIFMKDIVEAFRKKFTYPRVGYVKVPDEESSDVGRGILTYVGVLMLVLVGGIYLVYGGITTSAMYGWMPVGIGLFLSGAFQYNFSKTGDRMNWLYIATAVLGGISFSLRDFADAKEGLQLYLLFISVFFFIAGVIRFFAFRRNHPVLEEPEDE